MEKEEVMETGEGDALTYAVIGEAMRVHTDLGPGLDEMLYHDLLSRRLTDKGIAHQSKPRAQLLHRGLKADLFECDLLFERQLVSELKTLQATETFAPEHFAQLICYLKYWRIGTGLFLDFGKERLIFRRVAFTEPAVEISQARSAIHQAGYMASWRENSKILCDSILRVYQEHGLGYRDTTYRGLIASDLQAQQFSFVTNPDVLVESEGKVIGSARCHCLVANRIALVILALREKISTTDRSVTQTYLKHLQLQGGIIVNFGKRNLDLEFVNPPGVLRKPVNP